MEQLTLTVNNLWILLCAALVFIMHLGFSLVEIGLSRQKNALNILFKNFFVITSGLLLYALIGFNLMYPGFAGDDWGVLAFAGFGIAAPENGASHAYADGGYTWWADFLFQAMFAATTATIVSGAVAERIKLSAFFAITLVFVGVIYPVLGSWKWGGGFLDKLGFIDFAGSTIVHSVGGWAALVTIFLLGARLGKFTKEGKSLVILGHNIPLAGAGVLLLWFGWFGFNGGSVLSAAPGAVSLVLVNTCLAAAAGGIAAMIATKLRYKNYDITMFMNGVLGGLVGITASADLMSPALSMLIGAVAGVIVLFGVALIDRCKLDDPVGAVPVHLFCGVWGTLAVGIVGPAAGAQQFLIQLAGVGVIGAACIASGAAVACAVRRTIGLRVGEDEERTGLDLAEHQLSAYPDFSSIQR